MALGLGLLPAKHEPFAAKCLGKEAKVMPGVRKNEWAKGACIPHCGQGAAWWRRALQHSQPHPGRLLPSIAAPSQRLGRVSPGRGPGLSGPCSAYRCPETLAGSKPQAESVSAHGTSNNHARRDQQFSSHHSTRIERAHQMAAYVCAEGGARETTVLTRFLCSSGFRCGMNSAAAVGGAHTSSRAMRHGLRGPNPRRASASRSTPSCSP